MSYTRYTPLNVWLDPASVTDVVAYIQNYLSENTIYSEEEIEELIHDYLEAHPELIGGVQSVNGKTGTVVLSASDINTQNNVTIESVLASLSSQISSIAASVATNTSKITSLTGRVTTAETQIDSEATVRANADTALSNRINALQGAVGSPLKADAVASMTDTSKIYVYTGSETGYTNGNWYYYNGSAWVSGGVYNAVAINTDSTLTVAGMAADAKATGDELNNLKSSFNILSTDGTVRFESSLFEYGWLWHGTISKYQSGVALKSRIVTTNIQVAPYDMTIVPLSSFSIAVALYSDADEWTSGGDAKSTKTVSLVKGQHFRICIIKTTEDTSEVADIQTYVNNVSVSSPLSDTITTASDNKYRIDVLSKNYISQSETASTLMPKRFGVVIGIDGLTLVKGKTYTVSLTPVTPIDLQTSSNGINPIIYKSDDTVGIRLGSVDRPNNVFSAKWTTSFIPTDTLVDCKLGAYVALPSVADYKIVFEIADTTEEVLVDDVNALKNGTALVPSYYKSYLNSRLSTIWSNDILIGNTGDSFMFITDMHDDNNYASPALAKYIMDNSAVGRIVFGGDYINEPSSKSLALQYLEQRVSKCRVSERAVFLRGNHETNPYGTGSLTSSEVYGIINKRIERYADTNGNNYYYFDNESQKIRYLILDTGESGDIDTAQETFVHDSTSQLDNTWTIVILSHMAIYTDGVDVRDNVQKYDVVDKVVSAISGTSARVACWVCGHTHKDLSYNTSTFPIICVTCDANGTQASTHTSDNRDAGTTNERAFDVFHVDTNTKTIYATRIGGGQYNVIATGDLTDNDRQWSYT